ncbi:ERVV2 protein, partial [Ptilonorhynchus violaceus]|nr:ERVV2 protein [Ptilonorhynchus violaceus]
TAQMGGVCTLVNSTCCTYTDESRQIATDIQAIWQHAKVLHEVPKDDTSWTMKLWETLTSWLPNLNWIKHLFVGLLLLGFILLGACIFTQCFLWCCQWTAISYDKWKKYKLRHKLEKGTYFQETN